MNPIITPQTKAKKDARRLIHQEVAARFSEQWKRAGLWHRLLLWLKIELEVAQEMKRRFPPHALFVANSVR